MRGFFIFVATFVFVCSTDALRDGLARKRLGPFPPNSRTPPRAARPPRNRYPPPPRVQLQQKPFPRLNPYENRQAATETQKPAQKRVLVLPIISEGYASTSFQGGASSSRKRVDYLATGVRDATPIYNNDIAATTTATTATTATTTTTHLPGQDAIKEKQLKKSQDQQLKLHLQELENLKGDGSKNTFSVQLSSTLGGGGRGPKRPTKKPAGIKGSVEKVSLFADGQKSELRASAAATTTATTASPTTTTTTTTPSPFVLQPGEDGVFATGADNAEASAAQFVRGTQKKKEQQVVLNPDEYVRFIATPPKQVNIVVPPSGQSRPKAGDSLIYQAGYQQVKDRQTVLEATNHEPKGWPISQVDLIKQDNEGNYYPLGKAPPKHESRLPGPLPKRKPARKPFAKPSVPKKKAKPTSIFDFLIPSFLSGKSSSDNDLESSKQVDQAPLQKLPVPTRPPNTFPQPAALGGRLNPIRIKVPNGFPPMGPPPEAFPKPPTLEDWQNYQQKTLLSRSNQVLFQDAEDPRINRLRPWPAAGSHQRLPSTPPQLTKLASRHSATLLANGPMPMATQPVRVLPRVPAGRNSAPFSERQAFSPPLGPGAMIRQPRPRMENEPYAPSGGHKTLLRQSERESFKARLKDPAFMMNLTKAHVYYDEDPSNRNINGLGDGGVTYLVPDSDPFAFRPEAKQSEKPLQPRYNLHDIAPQSRLIEYSDIYQPDVNVVYKPVETRVPKPAPTTTQSSTTTTTTATAKKPTTSSDLTADHVQLVLKQYLANPNQPDEKEIAPSLLYDPESNAVLMEYGAQPAPSPKVGKMEEERVVGDSDESHEADKKEGLAVTEVDDDVIVGSEDQLRDLILNDDGFATYLTHLDESLLGSLASEAGNLLHGESPNQPEMRIESLDRVFEPSTPPEESDWFVLNENGRRERPMSEDEIEDVIKLMEEHSAVSDKDPLPVTLSGGFLPSSSLTSERPFVS